MNVYAKAIAAFFGAGVPGGLAQLILFWIGVVPLAPEALQSIVTGIVLGAVAAATVLLSPANTITSGQLVTSAKAGELTAAIAGVEKPGDATAVAKAVSVPMVKAEIKAQEALDKPVPVPGGDGKAHSSTAKPVSKKGK